MAVQKAAIEQQEKSKYIRIAKKNYHARAIEEKKSSFKINILNVYDKMYALPCNH